jgi:hypothetical protein
MERSWENLKGRDYSEDLRVDEMIILEWILGKLGGCGLAASGSRQIQVVNTVITFGFHRKGGREGGIS